MINQHQLRKLNGNPPLPIIKTQGQDWPDPEPLTRHEHRDPYPMEALPDVMREAVREVTNFVQCSEALTACSALAATSTVVAGLVDVRRAEKLTGPTGLYFVVVADSGERKTTADKFFTKAIRHHDNDQEEQAKPKLKQYQSDMEAWEAEKKGILQAIRKAAKDGDDTGELKKQLASVGAKKPEKPLVPRLMVGDATTEALLYRLAREWPVAGVLSSEAGRVFGGHAMGKEGLMFTLSTLNSLWDGSVVPDVDRRTSESYRLQSARLTLGLAVQPEMLRQFLDRTNGLARGSGFLARVLFARPESTQGTRKFREAPEHWPALARFHARLGELLKHPVPFDGHGRLTPIMLDLSPEAKKDWVTFHDDVEAELTPFGELADARDVASKAADNAARLAAIFHALENGSSGVIGVESMRAAIRVVTWHLYEARRFFNQIAVPEEITNARSLEGWLVKRFREEGAYQVKANDILQSGPNPIREKKERNEAIRVLEEAGRLRQTRKANTNYVEINPKILSLKK